MQAIQSVKADDSLAGAQSPASNASPKGGSGGLFGILLALLQNQADGGGLFAAVSGAGDTAGEPEGGEQPPELAALIAGLLAQAKGTPPGTEAADAVDVDAGTANAAKTTATGTLALVDGETTVDDVLAAVKAPEPVPAKAVLLAQAKAPVVLTKAGEKPADQAKPPVSAQSVKPADAAPLAPAAAIGDEDVPVEAVKPAPAQAAKPGKLLELAEPWKPAAEYLQSLEASAASKGAATASVEAAVQRVTGTELAQASITHGAKAGPSQGIAQAGHAAAAAPAPPDFQSTVDALPDTAVRSVRYLVSRGESSVRVRLVPESLGELHVEISTHREAIVVRMTSQHIGVRDMLQSQAHLLREALAQHGVDVSKVTVMAETSPQQGFNAQTHRHAQSNAYSDGYGEPPPRGGTANGSRHGQQDPGQQDRRGAWYGSSFNMFV